MRRGALSVNENPQISQVMVTNGGDGYLRKASLAHFSLELFNGSNSSITVSTAGPSGTPADGQIWIQRAA